MKRYDFLVVGGGPVGCRAATKLSIAGHQVAVLERNPSVGGRVCCTGIVSVECLKRFKIPRELVLAELRGAQAFSPSGRILHISRGEAQAVVIDRGVFNAFMARQAQEMGADYLLDNRVESLSVKPDEVAASVERRDGTRETFLARAVVLACGFGSRLPEKLGLGKINSWTAGAQVEVEAPQLNSEVEVYVGRGVAPGFFAWLVPSGNGMALAGLMSRRAVDVHLTAFLEKLKATGKITRVTDRPCYRGITTGYTRKSSLARVLLAGDAAGQVKPLTGGGIYFGLLCADIAADTLHSAAETWDFSASGMALYQKKWKRLLGRELRLGRVGHSLFSRLSDDRIDWLFGMADKRGLDEKLAASNKVEFDWHGRAMLHMLKKTLLPFRKEDSDG
ncbi:MAG: NAD(P)/FAD-dependent oxidoreductase [Dehalococcoidia bacterium]|nr:NAD(P)/FAD-dependent oxidoreductase [Dehalococcoidia bacterium]